MDADDPVKFSLLTLTNDGAAPRRLSVFAYNDWVLGPPREGQHAHVVTELRRGDRRDPRAQSPTTRSSRGRVAFAHASERAALGDRRPPLVPRPQRLAGAAGGAAPTTL